MKRLLILGAWVLLSFGLRAAQTAQTHLFCLSLRFQQGVYHSSSGDFTMDLSTVSLASPNGELAPTFSSPDLFSSFLQYDTLFDEVVQEGEIDLNLPPFADVNNDGFDDFYESSVAVAGTSTGFFSSVIGQGTVRASWSRRAGSASGTCVLSFKNASGGALGDYTHTFELIEYTGPLVYTPGTNRVTGAVNLTRTGDDTSEWTGPIEFIKAATNRFDELILQHGAWTNAFSQTVNFSNDIDSFLRDLTLTTNYYGFLDFDDGDPNTSDPDYFTWILSIDDSNDADGDGIPDFSDDPGPTEEPVLFLAPTSANLSLTISGVVGRMHEVQQSSSLSHTNWNTVLTVTLTNTSQTVSLPLPADAASFWRVHLL